LFLPFEGALVACLKIGANQKPEISTNYFSNLERMDALTVKKESCSLSFPDKNAGFFGKKGNQLYLAAVYTESK
jgi:hypothetical protein